MKYDKFQYDRIFDTPVLHGASLMGGVFCREALRTAFAGIPGTVTKQYKEYMGITIKMPGGEAAVSFQILFLCICGIVVLLQWCCWEGVEKAVTGDSVQHLKGK